MSDDRPEVPPEPPDLPGEAAADAYGLRTGDGDSANPGHGIFPIVRYDPQGRVHLLGTGFFISTVGIFATARHVLMETFDEHGRERYPIGIIQFLRNGIYLQRSILRCTSHQTADVAVGVAAPMSNTKDGTPLMNPALTLTLIPPGIGTRVVTFAYPKHVNIIVDDVQTVHFRPTWFDGKIEEHLYNNCDIIAKCP